MFTTPLDCILILSAQVPASGFVINLKSPPLSSPALESEVTTCELMYAIPFPSSSALDASALFVLTNCTLPTAYPLFVASLPNSKVEAAVPTTLTYLAEVPLIPV